MAELEGTMEAAPASPSKSNSPVPSPAPSPSMTPSARKQNQCPHCPQSFSKLSHLRQHLLVHGEQRLHVCPHDGCNRSYKRADHLTRHVAVHDGVLHQCPWPGCKSSFTTKANMLRHHRRCHHTSPQGAHTVSLPGQQSSMQQPQAPPLCSQTSAPAASSLNMEERQASGEYQASEYGYNPRCSEDPAAGSMSMDGCAVPMGGHACDGAGPEHLVHAGLGGGHCGDGPVHASSDLQWNCLVNAASASGALTASGLPPHGGGEAASLSELLQRLGDTEWIPSMGTTEVHGEAGMQVAAGGCTPGGVRKQEGIGDWGGGSAWGADGEGEAGDGTQAESDELDCGWLLESGPGVHREAQAPSYSQVEDHGSSKLWGERGGTGSGTAAAGGAGAGNCSGVVQVGAGAPEGLFLDRQLPGDGPLTPDIVEKTAPVFCKEEETGNASMSYHADGGGNAPSSRYFTHVPQGVQQPAWPGTVRMDGNVSGGQMGMPPYRFLPHEGVDNSAVAARFSSCSSNNSSSSQWCRTSPDTAQFVEAGPLPRLYPPGGGAPDYAGGMGMMGGMQVPLPMPGAMSVSLSGSVSGSLSGSSSPPTSFPSASSYPVSPPCPAGPVPQASSSASAAAGAEAGSGSGSFVCGLCLESFSTGEHLQAHCTLMHRTVPCPECGRHISTARLRRHMRERHGTPGSGRQPKEHSCPYQDCGKTYTSKSNLVQHIQALHHQQRSFVCPEDGCGKAFVTKQSLHRHGRTVHAPPSTGGASDLSSPLEEDPGMDEEGLEQWLKGAGGRRPHAAQQFVADVFNGLQST